MKYSHNMTSLIIITITIFLLPQITHAENSNNKNMTQIQSTQQQARASSLRGYQVFQEICSNCHSMKHMTYSALSGLGFSDDQLINLSAGYKVADGLNEQCEHYMRPARPTDHFVSPFPSACAARLANNGSYPPDLSDIALRVRGGSEYIIALLTGYTNAPKQLPIPNNKYYNKAFPGHMIGMPQMLFDNSVTYEDGTKATALREAIDVASFLTFASNSYVSQVSHGDQIMASCLITASEEHSTVDFCQCITMRVSDSTTSEFVREELKEWLENKKISNDTKAVIGQCRSVSRAIQQPRTR